MVATKKEKKKLTLATQSLSLSLYTDRFYLLLYNTTQMSIFSFPNVWTTELTASEMLKKACIQCH